MFKFMDSFQDCLIRFAFPLALLFLSGAAAAGDLVIQPGDIRCAISEAVPVSIGPNGDLSVTITDSETCLPQSGPPAAPSLTVQVTAAIEPGAVELSWSSSDGATACQAQSIPSVTGWTGDQSLGQNQTTVIPGLQQGSYRFLLTCSNSSGTSPTTEVTASISSPTLAGCEDQPAPAGWTRLESGCRYDINSGWTGDDCTSWESVFVEGFTQVSGLTQRVATNRLQPQQYLALQFNTPALAPGQQGFMTSDRGGSFMEFHRRIWSISSCPGNFDRDAVLQETGCYGELTAIFHLQWGGPDSTRECKLQPNTAYFLNLIGTNSALGTAQNAIVPNCGPNENCGAVYDPQQGN